MKMPFVSWHLDSSYQFCKKKNSFANVGNTFHSSLKFDNSKKRRMSYIKKRKDLSRHPKAKLE